MQVGIVFILSCPVGISKTQHTWEAQQLRLCPSARNNSKSSAPEFFKHLFWPLVPPECDRVCVCVCLTVCLFLY